MVNEEKVKELYQLALYDNNKEKECHQMGEYYQGDYIWKEVIKSFFSGTITFFLLVVLWALKGSDTLLESLNKIDYMEFGVNFVLVYIAFLAIYLFITVVIYTVRYKIGRRELKRYEGHLKKVNKIYDREDKLKNQEVL